METNQSKLFSLIEKHKNAMLTTKQNDGYLKSRPMSLSKIDKDGTMWFFNNENSCNANEIKDHPQVNLSFEDENKMEFISVSGKAEISHDKEKMEELMTAMVKAWFPKGLKDPTISLIKVNFEKGAYWVTEESKLRQVFEITSALLKKEQVDIGEHETVNT